MKLRFHAIVLALLPAAAGCSSAIVGSSPPLDVLRSCEVSCEGAVGTERPPAQAMPKTRHPDATDPFAASVRLGVVDATTARQLVGDCFGAHAVVVSSVAAELALRLRDDVPDEIAFAGASGVASVVTRECQRSFVESFGFLAREDAAILDPVVGTYTIGSRLELVPRRVAGGGDWELELTTTSVDARDPCMGGEVSVLGVAERVQLDVPVLGQVQTRTRATLGQGEALLVIAPEVLRGDRVLLALVAPRWPTVSE